MKQKYYWTIFLPSIQLQWGQTASGEIFLLDKKLKMLLPGAATRFAKKKVKSAAREKTGTAKLTAASLQLMHTVTQ